MFGSEWLNTQHTLLYLLFMKKKKAMHPLTSQVWYIFLFIVV